MRRSFEPGLDTYRVVRNHGRLLISNTSSSPFDVEAGDFMLDLLKELWLFLSVRKKFWLLPIIIVLALFGVLIVFSQGSAVAPFIYTLF